MKNKRAKKDQNNRLIHFPKDTKVNHQNFPCLIGLTKGHSVSQ